jgi:hypothetical protein
MPSPEIRTAMQIGSGVCWTLVYLLIIKRGFQDKTYGMPLWALTANISWEFLFSFVLLTHATVQHVIDIVWCLFDAVIVFQFLRYGRTSFRGTLLERYFYLMFVVALAVSFGFIYTMTVRFETELAPGRVDGRFAAFSQNLMMSILFVAMLINRKDLSGQSIYIGLLKMLGTLLPSLLFYLIMPSDIFLNFLYVAIFAFDLLYVVLVYARCREMGINAWKRF